MCLELGYIVVSSLLKAICIFACVSNVYETHT